MTRYAEVAVFPHRVLITQRVPSAYTYLVPDEWPAVDAGYFVLAPFGKQQDFDRLVSGIVVRVLEDTPELKKIKPLQDLLHSAPVVSPARLELARWLSEYYVEPLSNCVRLFAPPGQSIHSDVEYTFHPHDAVLPQLGQTHSDVIELLRARGPLRAAQIHAAFPRRDWKRAIDQLIDQGWITPRRVLPPPSTRARRRRLIELATRAFDLDAIDLGHVSVAARRQAILEFLRRRDQPIELDWLAAETGATSTDLKFLEAHGLITYRFQEVLRDPLADKIFVPIEPPTLTHDQHQVWSQITNDLSLPPVRPRPPFLLHGITGSGKTEIYLRAVAEVLKQGKQAIVLVPEIALTPQTIRRFAVRFPDRLAVWHSELSLNERYDTWRRVQMGAVDIVVGARSALFLPFEQLGLIVLDEEHDHSYKQSEASQHAIPVRQPLYHARDAAIELARLTNATVILGSATPSLEAWTRAQRGEYRLLTLSRRILSHAQQLHLQQERYHVQVTPYQPADTDDARYTTLPPVDVVDMRAELKAGNTHIFSRRLQGALADVIKRGEQAILFMNRRGASTFVMCRDCGYVLLCPRCDSPLTYHEPLGSPIEPSAITPALICHTCNYREVQPKHCPVCGSARIRYFGTGTQKIERELVELFPSVRTLRWDRDTTTSKGSHEIILQRFSDHTADVLIGTQMIAKGLDLPLVTLVGVISADTSLHLPDFRASERTFQLLTQVAGRAGRGLLGGRAIIQTYTPDHYAIETASRHDYEAFAKRELEFRREAAYPPYMRIARLLVWDKNPDRAKRQAEKIADQLRDMLKKRGLSQAALIGPAPCFFSRLRDLYRWHIALRHADPASIVRELHLGVQWRIDIDPVNML